MRDIISHYLSGRRTRYTHHWSKIGHSTFPETQGMGPHGPVTYRNGYAMKLQLQWNPSCYSSCIGLASHLIPSIPPWASRKAPKLLLNPFGHCALFSSSKWARLPCRPTWSQWLCRRTLSGSRSSSTTTRIGLFLSLPCPPQYTATTFEYRAHPHPDNVSPRGCQLRAAEFSLFCS